MSKQPRVIALTGSPGTGKSTLASRLQKEGLTIITLEEAAESVDAVSQFGEFARSKSRNLPNGNGRATVTV